MKLFSGFYGYHEIFIYIRSYLGVNIQIRGYTGNNECNYFSQGVEYYNLTASHIKFSPRYGREGGGESLYNIHTLIYLSGSLEAQPVKQSFYIPLLLKSYLYSFSVKQYQLIHLYETFISTCPEDKLNFSIQSSVQPFL